MSRNKGGAGQLTGTAGTYYVMAQLAARGYHASCTFGNAPNVDILVASADGGRLISIQVKTANEARRGNPVKELQWMLGLKAAKQSNPHLFFAFVDFKSLDATTPPDVYVIPSAWIKEYCASWVDKVKWVRFHVSPQNVQQFKNNWNLIRSTLEQATV